MFCLQESNAEIFSDISQILMRIAQKHKRNWKGSKSDRVKNDNPTIGEVVSSNEEMTSVWDMFQYGISKEEMYPDQAPIITEVVDSMRQLPIVGKDTLTYILSIHVHVLRNIPEGRRDTTKANHRL